MFSIRGTGLCVTPWLFNCILFNSNKTILKGCSSFHVQRLQLSVSIMSSLFFHSKTGTCSLRNSGINCWNLRNKHSVFVLFTVTFCCGTNFDHGRFWSHAGYQFQNCGHTPLNQQNNAIICNFCQDPSKHLSCAKNLLCSNRYQKVSCWITCLGSCQWGKWGEKVTCLRGKCTCPGQPDEGFSSPVEVAFLRLILAAHDTRVTQENIHLFAFVILHDTVRVHTAVSKAVLWFILQQCYWRLCLGPCGTHQAGIFCA